MDKFIPCKVGWEIIQKKNQRLLEPISKSRFPLRLRRAVPSLPPRWNGSEGSSSSFHLGGGRVRVHVDYFPLHFFRALTAPYVSLQQSRARSKVLNLLSSKPQYPVKTGTNFISYLFRRADASARRNTAASGGFFFSAPPLMQASPLTTPSRPPRAFPCLHVKQKKMRLFQELMRHNSTS